MTEQDEGVRDFGEKSVMGMYKKKKLPKTSALRSDALHIIGSQRLDILIKC